MLWAVPYLSLLVASNSRMESKERTQLSVVQSKKLHYRQAEFTQHYDRTTLKPSARAKTLLFKSLADWHHNILKYYYELYVHVH